MRIFGWLAGGLSALHNIPQIVHVCRRKSAADISKSALLVRMVSLIFYVTHGLLIQDMPLIVMSAIIFLQTLFICMQMYRFQNDTLPAVATTPASPQAPQRTRPHTHPARPELRS